MTDVQAHHGSYPARSVAFLTKPPSELLEEPALDAMFGPVAQAD